MAVEVRRSEYALFQLISSRSFDIHRFLRGELETSESSCVRLYSGLSGRSCELGFDDFIAFVGVSPSKWETISAERFSHGDVLAELLDARLLVQNSREVSFEEEAQQTWWDPATLTFLRALIQKRGPNQEQVEYNRLLRNAAKDADKFVERYGQPPSEYYSHPGPHAPSPLPLQQLEEHSFFRRLLRRSTNRILDPSGRITLDQLSTLLQLCFRHHSKVQLGSHLTLLRKTSPSGGSLHPIEAFLSAPGVRGLQPGLYHYDVQSHGLKRLVEMEEGELRGLNARFADLQDFASNASCLVLLVARVPRHHWKYRRNPKSLPVIYTDAGHLSQTFYLATSHLGLGAFYTGAIDHEKVSEAFDLDRLSLIPLGLCGCGVPGDGPVQELEPELVPSTNRSS